MSDCYRGSARPRLRPRQRPSSKAKLGEPEVEALGLRLLARREHSAAELRRKLRRRGVEGGDIEIALRNLISRGWQDDVRFGHCYARSRAEKGYGPLRIRAELGARGLPPDVAADVVDRLDRDWRDVALHAVRQQFGLGPAKDAVDLARRLRFLQRRGFSSALCAAALRLGRFESE